MELQELAWKYFNAAKEKGVQEDLQVWFGRTEKTGCFLTFLLCGKVDTNYETLSNEFYSNDKYHYASEKGRFYNQDTFFVERLQEFPEAWLRYASHAHYRSEPADSIIENLKNYLDK